jgi:SMC interacting uncharacterized protein involved in chromosome segregation
MSARTIAMMNAQATALTQEQEVIAQWIMSQPHTGGIHAANYRKAAHDENMKRVAERSTQVTNLRDDLGKSMSLIATDLRIEINKTYIASQTDTKGISENVKTLAKSHEDVKNDVTYARHELTHIGEQYTTLNHLVTNRNKEFLVRIETLEREVTRLLTPPPKKTVHWIELLVTVGTVLLAMGVLYLQNKPTLPMIGY